MSKSFLRSINLLLRPGLVNLVGVHKLHDNFKCKILVDENSSSNKQVTEIQNDNPSSHRQRWIRHYDRIYDNLQPITENYEGNYEFDENFTESQDFQKKLLTILNEYYVSQSDGSETGSRSEESFGDSHNDFYIALAISINGKMVLKKAYGNQDRENLVPAKPDMVGEIGSITKTFTALMIMKLIEEEAESKESPPHKKRCSESDEESDSGNRITLDTYVEDILTPDVWPEHFVKGETDRKKYKITIRQLLQHCSGIDLEEDPSIDRDKNDNEGSLLESIRNINSYDLANYPGSIFAYSNYGYQLLALVYEKRTGRSFVEDLRDEFAKMGLYDTDFNYREHLALDKARGYMFFSSRGSSRSSDSEDRRSDEGSTEGDSTLEKSSYIDISWHEASYGLVSTVSDLVKYGNIFASCLLNNENLDTNPLNNNQANKMVDDKIPVRSTTDRNWIKWRKEFYQGLGWVVKLVAPLHSENDNIFLPEFAFNSIEHGGSTEFNQSQLSLHKESGCKTQHHKVLQKRPLMYPLGEDFESHQDYIVGAIIIERLENQNMEKLLSKIMNFVRYEYLRNA